MTNRPSPFAYPRGQEGARPVGSGEEGGACALNNALLVLSYALLLVAAPWLLWSLTRTVWMHRRERQVLKEKYGDLPRYAERLKEWRIVR
mgnify:CR=1 FL=1